MIKKIFRLENEKIKQNHHYLLVPVVRVTGVLPATRLMNTAGALISYHSLRENGSAL